MIFSVKNLLAALAFIMDKLDKHALAQRNRAADLRSNAAQLVYESEVADKDAVVAAKLAANIGKLMK